MSEERSLADWLRAAYADPAAGCPPPEAWLAEELAALSPAERERLLAHAAACPACAGERELAAAFDAGAAGADPADVAWIASRLAEQPPVGRRPATAGEEEAAAAEPRLAEVRPFPTAAAAADPAGAAEPSEGGPGNGRSSRVVPFRGRRAVRWVRLAAAAVLVVAAGLIFQTLHLTSSPLPEPPGQGAVRGGRVEGAGPAGELAELPAELRWQPLAGAAAYRVRLLGPADDALWEGEVAGSPAQLPAEVIAELHRAVSYRWYVEALAADGTVLGRSETVRFRAAPEPEEPTED